MDRALKLWLDRPIELGLCSQEMIQGMIQELATGWSPELATGSSPELSSGMDPELKLRISVRRYRSAPDSRQSGMYPGSVLALGPDSDFVGPTFL